MQPDASPLSRALARGELAAWFQPQIELETEAIVGLEALCRWRDPARGFVPPAEFIPLAEETGAIDDVGRFMAEQAMAAAGAWSRPFRPMSISVNVSPLQLETGTFTEWLIDEVEGRRLRTGTLVVEITESRRVADAPAVVRRLDELRAAGVGIAIDDFGMGQASLTQLKRLHATELKIDRSLVQDPSADAVARITEAVAAGHALGARIVAEGIETVAQLRRARDLGCERAQGYLLGKPMPAAQVDRMLGPLP